jgi:ABC-type transport system substrate-binding protein
MFNKESDAVIGRKGVDYPDGLSVLTYFKGKYEANYFHVNDPKTDSAIAEATKEFNTEKRIQKYKDIQIQILKYYTNIPLFFGSRASGLWSQKVKSVPSHPMGFHTMHLEAVEMRSR